MSFPSTRMRRLRINPLVRTRVQEVELSARRLIAPLFVRSGKNVRNPVSSMPGQYQMSVDVLIEEAKRLRHQGITSLLLFGIPERKDSVGSQAYSPNGIIQVALRALKKAIPDVLLIADLCFCEYTSHGHC